MMDNLRMSFFLLVTSLIPAFKTAPAQPSFHNPPGFGTPEGTAKIAASLSSFDVAGISLGMPLQDAVAAIKALNPAFNQPGEIVIGGLVSPADYDRGVRAVEQNGRMPTYPTSVRATYSASPSTAEEITLDFTNPPSRPFVLAIKRLVNYPPGQQASVEAVLAGLHKKYGPESYKSRQGPIGADLTWIFGPQGRLVTGATVNFETLGFSCAFYQREITASLDVFTARPGQNVSIPDPNQIAAAINDERDLCQHFTVIQAQFDANAAGLVERATVTMSSRPLGRSAALATMNFTLEQIQKRREQKESDVSPKF